MTPEDTFELACAVYLELKLLGHPANPPPEGAKRAWLHDAVECHSVFNREMWLYFVCEPRDGRPLWTLFFRSPINEPNHLEAIFERFKDALFKP